MGSPALCPRCAVAAATRLRAAAAVAQRSQQWRRAAQSVGVGFGRRCGGHAAVGDVWLPRMRLREPRSCESDAKKVA